MRGLLQSDFPDQDGSVSRLQGSFAFHSGIDMRKKTCTLRKALCPNSVFFFGRLNCCADRLISITFSEG